MKNPDELRQFATLEEIWDAIKIHTVFYQVFACHGQEKISASLCTEKTAIYLGHRFEPAIVGYSVTRFDFNPHDLSKENFFLNDQQNMKGKAIFTNRGMAEEYLAEWKKHLSKEAA